MKTISYTATLVLQAVSRQLAYGFDIMGATGLPAGTVYPILRRLEAAGLLTSRWENATELSGEGRPRRRYYGLTEAGTEALKQARQRLEEQRELLDAGDPYRA